MQVENLRELGWTNFFQSQLSLDSYETELPFRVTSVQRNLIDCVGFDRNGELQNLQLSTHCWREKSPEEYPTVGDWLLLDFDLLPIVLLDRKTLIKRKSAGSESSVQLIAANIDTVFIVTSCNDDFNLNRIERYLAVVAESQVDAVIVLTKTDLCEDVSVFTEQLRLAYPRVPVETIVATDSAELDVLISWCGKGNTVALIGSSGVGKSTIINSLVSDAEQSTGPVRESDSKGKHTTTSRSMHQLKDNAILIDTPGMRELQIIDCEEGVHAVFSDIGELAKTCRFSDCQHKSEPGCAVRKEIDIGNLDERRLRNFQKLMAEQSRHSHTIAERRSNERELTKFYKNTMDGARRFKSREE